MLIKIALTIFLFFSVLVSNAQKVTNAKFRISSRTNYFRSIDLIINDHILVVIDNSGQIEYVETDRTNGNERILEEMGFPVKYYDDFDIHDPRGKLKSIGNLVFKYNNNFDIHEKFGTLKSIGDIQIKYYNTFDIHDPQGKVKSVGKVDIKYFNKMDFNERFGLIKSITGNDSYISVTGR